MCAAWPTMQILLPTTVPIDLARTDQSPMRSAGATSTQCRYISTFWGPLIAPVTAVACQAQTYCKQLQCCTQPGQQGANLHCTLAGATSGPLSEHGHGPCRTKERALLDKSWCLIHLFVEDRSCPWCTVTSHLAQSIALGTLYADGSSTDHLESFRRNAWQRTSLIYTPLDNVAGTGSYLRLLLNGGRSKDIRPWVSQHELVTSMVEPQTLAGWCTRPLVVPPGSTAAAWQTHPA
jgi:hypothetical protein